VERKAKRGPPGEKLLGSVVLRPVPGEKRGRLDYKHTIPVSLKVMEGGGELFRRESQNCLPTGREKKKKKESASYRGEQRRGWREEEDGKEGKNR